MSGFPLFDAPASFDRAGLAEKLRRLASEHVWLGTSSWKYEGWLGQIYTRERYLTRGRFSKRAFEAECLKEYAETFPIVCGDFSFYQFPSEEYWRKLFLSAPSELRYALKVPEEVTVKVFPDHARYGARAGLENPTFLDAHLLEDAFLRPLEPYRRQLSALIFEFGTFSQKNYETAQRFVEDLDRFLAALPAGFRYSVEIRNPEYLGPEYLGCLRAHNVAHVLNAWDRMPGVAAQLVVPGIFTSDFTVCRALLRRGRAYAKAVDLFTPYNRVQEPLPRTRGALRELIRRAREQRIEAFIFVNNRLEGNAPETIRAIVED